ncbi:MAG: acylase [Gammaproteobacteria bacterium]|nr:acylase [Gammaproteobacteria bacterium]
MYKKNLKLSVIILLSFGTLLSCSQNQDLVELDQYKAEIIRTSYGIPHITAADYASLGFGEGYAAAQDHVCNIAHGIVVARGERAKYHGEGDKKQHLLSDIVIKSMEIPDRAKEEYDAQSLENRQWIAGYADGYNKYVREVGKDNITSWCKGADWVKEITPEALYSRFQVLSQSAPRMAGMIVSAHPPSEKANKVSFIEIEQQTFTDEIDTIKSKYLGSNGWSFGKDRTENGRGMLLGNPHYPWTGTSRFWEKHLIIPGRLNIYGSHLVGAPGVAIGFNENIGWTHTVSNSERVVFYKLDLVPGDPTSYYYNGQPRKMVPHKIVVDVKGQEEAKQHTVWFSHYGPIVSLPGVKWSSKQALTMKDANFRNQNLVSQWKAMDLATDMDSFKDAHRKWNAMPWVNTIATSSDGRAVYIDGSNVGRLSPEAIALWREQVKTDALTKKFHNSMGLILLDGSDSRFEWTTHSDARVAGVVPFSEKPKLERTDYIFNANDSHWLTHVDEPLVGYSPLYGPEGTARSLRTRMNAKLVSDMSKTGPAGEDGKFSLKEMQQALFSNRSLTAELLVDELVAACELQSTVKVGDKTINLSEACSVMKSYNKRLNLDSKGAVLFREWITLYKYTETFKQGTLFAIPFDVADPVNTPRELADKNLALQKLGQAAQLMEKAGLKLDSTLGETQFAYRGDEKIAIHGGSSAEGIANVIGQRNYDTQATQVRGAKIDGSKFLTDKGYAITYGTSFLLSLSYTDSGPEAEAFLTYGGSGDPSSEHYTDQTNLFSKKQWRPILYKIEDIKKDAKSSLILTGNR